MEMLDRFADIDFARPESVVEKMALPAIRRGMEGVNTRQDPTE